MKLLLDEMYPAALAEALRAAGIGTCTVRELGLAGRSDPEVFAEAVALGYTILTENVADFVRISAEQSAAGQQHPGVLIALSSRFSRRPAGISTLLAAIQAVASEPLGDRVVFLPHPDRG